MLQNLRTKSDLKIEEEVAFYYLKDFVGNMDQEVLERFLRFVTGRLSAFGCEVWPGRPIHFRRFEFD